MLQLTFKNTYGIGLFIVDDHIRKMYHIHFSAFDMGVVGLFKQVTGNLFRGLVRRSVVQEQFRNRFVDLVELQIYIIEKSKIVLFLLPKRFKKVFFEQSGHFIIQGKGLRGQKGRFVFTLIAHSVEGDTFNLGGI
jgi:hypothetical protein